MCSRTFHGACSESGQFGWPENVGADRDSGAKNVRVINVLVTGRVFLHLEKLAFDRPHPRHQSVQLGEEGLFVLLGLLDKFRRGTMAYAVEGVSQLPVQKPHALLQLQEFLV